MTPLQDVFMLDANDRVDADTVARIWQSGRSRIPVCDREPTNVIGTFLFLLFYHLLITIITITIYSTIIPRITIN